MNLMKVILLFTLIFLLTNCGSKSKKDNLIKYIVLKEEIYDKPIKTQIELDILIKPDSLTEQQIKDLLAHLHGELKKRSGFQYHKNPTSIYIYAYTSKEKANSGMGQWIGMSRKSHNDKDPKILISEVQFKALNTPKENKFGLSDEQRKEIWTKKVKAEDKAQKEADKKYTMLITDPAYKQSNIEKNINLTNYLSKKYKVELIAEYNLKEGIFDSISIEGLVKGWPFPEY